MVSWLDTRSGEQETMSEPSFLDLFRSRWQELARQLWPETPHEQLRLELTRLDAELRRQQSCLLLFRKRIEKIHDRLKHRQYCLELLTARMQKAPADGDAIAEREHQERYIDRLEERLRQLEHGYTRRLARLLLRKQKRAELRERLLSESLPKRMDEESDPDYPF